MGYGLQIPYFITILPYVTRCDIMNAMYGEHLSKSYIFSNISAAFLRQITIYLKRYVFFPGNYILQQGDIDDTMYIIHRGEVALKIIFHLHILKLIK